MSDIKFTSKVRTCLWFEKDGEAAARFYVSLLPDSAIETVSYPDPDGLALVTEFTLAGAPFMTLNGGPMYEQSPAASISVLTKDQAETDRLWQKLLEDGGKESQCGWIFDKYGVSWQVIPEVMAKMMNQSADTAAAMRAREAMFKMKKIDIAALKAAFNDRKKET
ncbi:VOC family protein [Robiginitomaculum antarcticum]|uniref:VOC family protein n=1 Tax=Robiginitomaculum antarcticum TaxID=437507 RepID=UPI000375050F|nr:VOC family protein [Robiginitomaculum antarcticum]